MKIKFLIAAEEHLDDIYNQIAKKSERAAINILSRRRYRLYSRYLGLSPESPDEYQ